MVKLEVRGPWSGTEGGSVDLEGEGDRTQVSSESSKRGK